MTRNTRIGWLAPLVAGVVLTAGTPPAVAQSARVEGQVTLHGVPVQHAVVYLVRDDPGAARAVAPVRALIDQRDLRFVPGLVAVPPGSAVEFPNSDAVLHNVFNPGGAGGAGFDLGTYASRERRSITFTREGAYVILCHMHPEMAAYVFVVDAPYRTVSDADGRFLLEGVPAGAWRLHVWQRRALPLEVALALAPGETRSLSPTLVAARKGRWPTVRIIQ